MKTLLIIIVLFIGFYRVVRELTEIKRLIQEGQKQEPEEAGKGKERHYFRIYFNKRKRNLENEDEKKMSS